VVNYLSLFHETKNMQFLKQAEALVDDVHNTLGFQRGMMENKRRKMISK